MLSVPPRDPKKSELIGLRLEKELLSDFTDALSTSDMSAQDALRKAVRAMIEARRKFGRIPNDMEIRQAAIGDLLDMDSLLGRVQALAEHQAPYLVQKPKKPPLEKPSPKSGGTGPVALVSDLPA